MAKRSDSMAPSGWRRSRLVRPALSAFSAADQRCLVPTPSPKAVGDHPQPSLPDDRVDRAASADVEQSHAIAPVSGGVACVDATTGQTDVACGAVGVAVAARYACIGDTGLVTAAVGVALAAGLDDIAGAAGEPTTAMEQGRKRAVTADRKRRRSGRRRTALRTRRSTFPPVPSH